jgi:hypothetical protein
MEAFIKYLEKSIKTDKPPIIFTEQEKKENEKHCKELYEDLKVGKVEQLVQKERTIAAITPETIITTTQL